MARAREAGGRRSPGRTERAEGAHGGCTAWGLLGLLRSWAEWGVGGSTNHLTTFVEDEDGSDR